jgi:hypothetical protein
MAKWPTPVLLILALATIVIWAMLGRAAFEPRLRPVPREAGQEQRGLVVMRGPPDAQPRFIRAGGAGPPPLPGRNQSAL